MSGEHGAMFNKRDIMARVSSVLDPTGNDDLNAAQRTLFDLVSGQIDKFEGDRKCPVVSVGHHVGNYWRHWLLLIVRTGSYRPSTLMRLIAAIDPSHPISHRMLTLNLRLLERDGLVERHAIDDEIKHVEYTSTQLGNELSDWIRGLIEWIDRRSDQIAEARIFFDTGEQDRQV